MMILLYYRYSEFRINSVNEAKKVSEKYEEQLNVLRIANDKVIKDSKESNDKLQSLLSEINNLRKEKENEAKLRLNAEKQIELTMQKAEEVDKRINDWHEMQEAVMKDCMDSIFKVGNDLYKKLNESYKVETETSKNIIGKFSKNISDLFEKFSKPNAFEDKPHDKIKEAAEVKTAASVKDAVSNIVDTMKSSGLLVGRDYFLPQNFDPKIAQLMLCELVFFKGHHLYFIDFKGLRYFEEYEALKGKNKDVALENLKQRLDKYFVYLSNPKYSESILKVLAARKIKFDKISIVSFVSSPNEIAVLKESGYNQKAQDLKVEIVDSNEINNIIL